MLQVGAAVISQGDTVLVCRRRDTGPHPNKWEFPGGKREHRETLESCVRRELREELAIEARIGNWLWHTCHRYPGQAPIELFFFGISDYRGQVENLAFAEVRWVEVGTLSELDFLEADRELVERLDCGQISV